MDEITIYADAIEDIYPANKGKGVELTVSGLDMKALAKEIDLDILLDHCKISEIKDYLKKRTNG